MDKMTAHAQLVDIVKHNVGHAKKGTIDQADDVFKVPASNYTDPERFEQEKEKVFRRLPLVLASTPELPNKGDYKSIDVMGAPVLIVRGNDGKVRAFQNSCTHRGAPVADVGRGSKKRFICPYHAWTFDLEGKLTAIASHDEFGDIDMGCYNMTQLPAEERAGLIWVILNPKSTVNISDFLAGYDDLLAQFNFQDWILFDQRTVRGPNWKIAYDGYLDLYHLPVLHRNTFGGDISNQALYYAWGPHQHVTSPSRHFTNMMEMPEDKWNMAAMLMGVWTIFPHISIASFDGGGRGVMLSQLIPGEHVGESYTTQYYLMENKPDESQEVEAHKQFKLLEYVVETEDYGTGLRQQQALNNGMRDHVLFGRNEGGGRRFHGWVDKILGAETDDELNAMFKAASREVG